MKAASGRVKGLETSSFSPLRLEEMEEPKLPAPGWVRVRPRLSGVCGSDLSTILSKSSPYFSPLTSPPFVLGHEVVGEVADDGSGFAAGERVVIEPALGCEVRGLSPPCPRCAAGEHALCERVTEGDISPGIQTGFCRDTGGGWCSGTLVAHPSQLHRVPEGMADEAAVAVEPLACAVHAALRARQGETIVVVGAGSVGLLTVAAIKHLTGAGRILCVAKHDRQRREALRLGADGVVSPAEAYTTLVQRLGARAHRPELGKPVVLGGADRVFECIGAASTVADAVRLTRPGGEVELVGMPGARTAADFTPLWHQEVSLRGAYAYGVEEYGGERRRTFDLALSLAPELGLEGMVGPLFKLSDYREAIAAARSSGRNGRVKVAFDLRGAA